MPLPGETESKTEKRTRVLRRLSDQLSRTFGDSGTNRGGGYFQEEYNTDWRDEKRIDIVEEMRRGDASVKAALRAIKSPILAGEWNVVCDSQDPNDEEIRKFVEHSLFSMKRSWKKFLREALAYLDFGHYVFELIWELKDGKIVLKDLEPRIPHSIQKWQLADKSFGIVQRVYGDDRKIGEVEIPATKLLILTNEQEGDDVTGQSILRAAFKHWDILKDLYQTQMVSVERYGVGIPIIYPGEGASDEDLDKAEEMGENLRSNEKGYIVMPGAKKEGGWVIEILTPGSNSTSAQIDSAIQNHSIKILMSVLATFLQLGTDGVGSLALSQDQSSFFLKCLQDVASYVSEEISNQIIKQIVDLNFGVQEWYPYLKCTSLGDVDFGEFSSTLSTLAGAGLVKQDAKLMQFIHREFKLPEISEEDMEMMEEQELEQQLAGLEGGEGDGMAIPPDETVPPEEVPPEEEPVPPEE